jgi:hypothetical protein
MYASIKVASLPLASKKTRRSGKKVSFQHTGIPRTRAIAQQEIYLPRSHSGPFVYTTFNFIFANADSTSSRTLVASLESKLFIFTPAMVDWFLSYHAWKR